MLSSLMRIAASPTESLGDTHSTSIFMISWHRMACSLSTGSAGPPVRPAAVGPAEPLDHAWSYSHVACGTARRHGSRFGAVLARPANGPLAPRSLLDPHERSLPGRSSERA